MSGLVIARALHVLAVVIWIGGVSMVTTIVLPAVRRGDLGHDRLRALKSIERRFVWHARAAVFVVGATGFYLLGRLHLWWRFQLPRFWWMHAMVGSCGYIALMLSCLGSRSSRYSEPWLVVMDGCSENLGMIRAPPVAGFLAFELAQFGQC